MTTDNINFFEEEIILFLKIVLNRKLILHNESASTMFKVYLLFHYNTCDIYKNYSQMKMKKQILASLWVSGLENAEGK